MAGTGSRIALVLLSLGALSVPAAAQAPLRKIGEMELSLLGLSATVDPANPVVPKNTPSAVRIVVRAGTRELSAGEVAELVGAGFKLEGELSGPGLRRTLTLPQVNPNEPPLSDPLLLALPGLTVSGDYELTNIRIVAGGQPVLEAEPQRVPLKVIEQILITSVKTRPLTLEEIEKAGIVLDSKSYLGFQFTLGLLLESKAVNISLPVIFDRKGVVVPQPQIPPAPPPRVGNVQLPSLPTIVPLLLEPEGEEGGGSGPSLQLPGFGEGAVRIPSLLVIPGNVGYLKQFFSVQLFVANGAPTGSGLVVKDIFGTIELPPKIDPNAPLPPLDLPDTVKGPQEPTVRVKQLGPDSEAGTTDDVEELLPTEQGQAELFVRGNEEGYWPVKFEIKATLDGLPVGPVKVKGKAQGGVLVRNPAFDMSFTVPSVVRNKEKFKVFVTVTNVGQAAANKLTVSLDQAALSVGSLELAPGETGVRSADSLQPRNSKTFAFEFKSLKTGAVQATYLRFDTPDVKSGTLNFKVGVVERGVPASPDTLVLPASVDALGSVPGGLSVVEAAMRVLGQAWSVATAPAGTLPRGVIRTDKSLVTQKAIALAEAGLRVTLGEKGEDAIRDVLFDFYAGEDVDPGFDQLLRQSEAGHELTRAIGAALAETAGQQGPIEYQQAVSRVAVSGPDFIAFAVGSGNGPAPVDVTLFDAAGQRTVAPPSTGLDPLPTTDVTGAVMVPLGTPGSAPVLALVAAPKGSPYTLELIPRGGGGPVDVAVTVPRTDGTFVRGTILGADVFAPGRARLTVDLSNPDALTLERDLDGDGTYDPVAAIPLATSTLYPEGPSFQSANIIGPETLSGASPFGVYAAFLFDRVVDATSAAVKSNYVIPSNAVQVARRQLTGRLVFASLVQPEGPYIESEVTARGIADGRGVIGLETTVPLSSRLEDPGAVVSGRVINADGSPVPSAVVTYLNNQNLSCLGQIDKGVAAIPIDENGQFEFRYVRQDQCGFPFTILTQDPTTGGERKATNYVRATGERIVMDLALFAKGSVTGTVKKLEAPGSSATVPVPGAKVVVLSVTDPQSFGVATTDGDGRYGVAGITVGPITVSASAGTDAGRNSGRIDRPGTPAVVDVLLDGGVVSIKGTVTKLEKGESSVVPGINVLYHLAGQLLAATQTDGVGEYRFEGLPAGRFKVTAALNQRDNGFFEGDGTVGPPITANILIEVPPDEQLGTVSGTVFLADGVTRAPGLLEDGVTPAPDVIVSVGDRGVVVKYGDNGVFTIPGIPLRTSLTISARSRDGKKSGFRSFGFTPGSSVATVNVTLSGLGSALFTVRDPEGKPIPGLEVLQLGNCINPCGCRGKSTDFKGEVTFNDLGVGGVFVRAYRPGAGFMDVASGSAVVPGNGLTGSGIVQFNGAGSVKVKVFDPPVSPGAQPGPSRNTDVVLVSRIFINDGFLTCGLVPGPSHRGRTDQNGELLFTGVTVGSVSVTATNPFQKSVGARGNLSSNGEEVSFTLQILDSTAGELSGNVTLPDGKTSAGAGVEVTANGPLPDVTVRTDADGHYRFAPIFPEGTYTLIARDPQTGGVAREQTFLRAGQPAVRDLRLEGRGTVVVRVVDGAGQPLEKAFVKLRETDFPNGSYESAIEPASDGRATFENVFEGSFSVEVSEPNGRGGRGSGVLPKPGDVVEILVRVTTTGTVKGHFRMPPPSSAPIPFGTVKLIAGGRVIGQATTASTGDVGSFSFTFVPAGQLRLEAQDPLTARTGIQIGELRTEGQIVELDVVAQAIGSVTGTITSNAVKEPLAQVEVVSGSYKASTIADGDGVYRIDGVPEGLVVVTAKNAAGGLSATRSATLSGEGGPPLVIDVPLREVADVVAGQVVPAPGAPPGFKVPPSVVTVDVSGGARQSTTTDADGRFRFVKVPAGLATFTVDVGGSIDRARKQMEIPARATIEDLVLPLNGIGSIDGAATGIPPGYTSVDVVINGTGAFAYQFVFPLSGDSTFRLPEVLAGPFTATLRAFADPRPRLYGSAQGTVEPFQETPLTLALQDTGGVQGIVVRADGKAAFGAEVKVQTSSGLIKLPAQQQGDFFTEGVPVGLVKINATDALTGGIGLAEGTVVKGETLPVGEIRLDDTPISVVSVDPADDTAGVAIDAPVTLTFSDPVSNFSTFNVFVRSGAFTLPASLTSSADKLSVTLRPSGQWPDARELTVFATTGIVDVFGRNMQQTFTSRFRTVDLSPPKVAAIAPVNFAVEVDPATTIVVTFDEPLKADQDVSALVALSGPAGPVTGTTTRSATNTVTFTPAQPLALNARYTVIVNGAVDESGNTQTVAFTSSFRTLDTIPPVLSLSQPPGEWVKTARPLIQVTMNDGPLGIGVAAATARLFLDGAEVAAGINPLSFTPPLPGLTEGPHTVTAEAKDLAGNLGMLAPSIFKVDTVAPDPAVIGGVKDGDVISGTVTLSATASDGGSGVATIDFLRDGTKFLTGTPPSFSVNFVTSTVADGSYVLTARAVDVAGNVGPAGPPVNIIVDNKPLTVKITSPAPGARFALEVTVRAEVSEPVRQVDFSVETEVGRETVTGTAVDAKTYQATLDLRQVKEDPSGTAVTVIAFGLVPPDASAAINIFVDRTPPLPPDGSRIEAEPPSGGSSLVHGRAGAVEPKARVEITNTANSQTATTNALADGSFAASIPAAVDDVLSLVAVDSVDNRSDPTTVVVRRTPSLPPGDGTTSLRFEGVLVDRVGPGAAALSPDGSLDAVFTMTVAIGNGLTRQLSFIDLARTTGAPASRSTRSGSVLGVAVDAGAPLLNAPNGDVSFPVTTSASLTLFAADFGFIQGGASYTVTAGFTDGSRFVGSVTIVAPEDKTQVAHSVRITATPSTVVVTGPTPGTTVLTLNDIRDIEGTLVPDGAKVAVAVTDMASKDPRGNAIRSAGGTIPDCSPAPNNSNFCVFTLASGQVAASYSSAPVTPTTLSGALTVVQVQAADAAGNVLGTEAIGTYDLNLRASTDRAIVSVATSSLYADKGDRRSMVSIQVRDASGTPVPDGTKILVSAANNASVVGCCFVSSAGGQILGGADSPSGTQYRAFTVAGGVVQCEYSSSGVSASNVGQVRSAMVQVLAADANGAAVSNAALGTASIALTGASAAEVRLSRESVPFVFPERPVQVVVHHVHDARANLVPDGAKLLLTATNNATLVGCCFVSSVGGTITDGMPSSSGSGFKFFPLTLGEIVATYTTAGASANPGEVRTANIQLAMGDPNGVRLDQNAVAVKPLQVVAPSNAVGTAEPPSLLADGGLHTSTVVFDPVLDSFGNPLPDGSKVLASAASNAGVIGCCFVQSAGGQILNGDLSPTGPEYKVLTVQGGVLTVTYGDQGVTANPGQVRDANVVLLEAGASGERLSQTAVGVVRVGLAGLTSAVGTASPPAVHADGGDRRSTVTLSDLRDAAGRAVPDGTLVALSANNNASVVGCCFVSSAGGQIVGGATSPTMPAHYRLFPVTNGQVVVQYSAQGVAVATGEKTAVVQALTVTPEGGQISLNAVATVPIRLLAPASATVGVNPADLFSDGGERLSEIRITDLVDSGGTPIPDGSRVGLTVANNAAITPDGCCFIGSAGGQILTAGTTPGDGTVATNNNSFRIFTVAGGEVRAVYSAQNLPAGVNETKTVKVAVVHADPAGAIVTQRAFAVGTIQLRGMTSATASGPASLPRGGATGTVTFSGIKDSAGNTVPDGTLVVVTAANNATVDSTGCCFNSSAGGTIVDGSPSPSANFKVFTVTGGSVTVTYSTTGASLGTARVQLAPARPDGTIINNRSLAGGVWAITVTN